MSRFRSSRGSLFKGRVRESKDGYYEVSVPPHVVEQENIARKKVRFRVEEIQEED